MSEKKENPVYIKIPVIVYNNGMINIKNNCKIEDGKYDFIFEKSTDKAIYGYREGFIIKCVKK